MIPYGLLLALLYSLGKLSGSREIIAMIQSGRSLVRITMPLIVAGVFFSLLCLGLNYHWAPSPKGMWRSFWRKPAASPRPRRATCFTETGNRRLWLIGTFPKDYQTGKPLRNVEITTTRPDMTWKAGSARKARPGTATPANGHSRSRWSAISSPTSRSSLRPTTDR